MRKSISHTGYNIVDTASHFKKPKEEKKHMQKVASLLETIERMRGGESEKSTINQMRTIADERNAVINASDVNLKDFNASLSKLKAQQDTMQAGLLLPSTLKAAVQGGSAYLGAKKVIGGFLGAVPITNRLSIGVGAGAAAGGMLLRYIQRKVAERNYNDTLQQIEDGIVGATGVSIDDVRRIGSMTNLYSLPMHNSRKLVKIASSLHVAAESESSITPRVRMMVDAASRISHASSNALSYGRKKADEIYVNHLKKHTGKIAKAAN